MKRKGDRAVTITGGLLTGAAVLVALMTLFGDSVRNLFGMSADALAGESLLAPRTRVDGLERKSL